MAKGRTVAIIAVVVIVGFLALLYFGSRGLVPSVVENYPKVTVTGTVKTVGVGTSPIRVDLKSNTGAFSAEVTNGRYSINLPNRATYQLTVSWKSIAGIQTGTCNGGSLNLNIDSSEYIRDISC